jgi:hypothetical protein
MRIILLGVSAMFKNVPLVLLAAVFALLNLPAHASVIPAFAEVGDAGDFLSPQDVVGTGLSAITGNIGDTDTVDAFRFYFGGGPLAIIASLDSDGTGLPINFPKRSAVRTCL